MHHELHWASHGLQLRFESISAKSNVMYLAFLFVGPPLATLDAEQTLHAVWARDARRQRLRAVRQQTFSYGHSVCGWQSGRWGERRQSHRGGQGGDQGLRGPASHDLLPARRLLLGFLESCAGARWLLKRREGREAAADRMSHC